MPPLCPGRDVYRGDVGRRHFRLGDFRAAVGLRTRPRFGPGNIQNKVIVFVTPANAADVRSCMYLDSQHNEQVKSRKS